MRLLVVFALVACARPRGSIVPTGAKLGRDEILRRMALDVQRFNTAVIEVLDAQAPSYCSVTYDGERWWRDFDEHGRPAVDHYDGPHTELPRQVRYAYVVTERGTSVTKTAGNRLGTSYFDPGGHLVRLEWTAGGSACAETYTYDATGCLASKERACRGRTEREAFTCEQGRVVHTASSEGDERVVRYDARGRPIDIMVVKLDGEDANVTSPLVYDSQGRLVRSDGSVIVWDDAALAVEVRQGRKTFRFEYGCRLAR